MRKKLFIKLSMLLFVLAMSTNVAWALADEWSGWTNTYAGEYTPSNWFYVQLNAKISTSSCAETSPGTMKLSFTNNNGDIEDATWIYGPLPTIPAAYENTNAWAWIDGFNFGVTDFKNGEFKEDWQTHDWGWSQGQGSPEYTATSLGYKVGYDWANGGNCNLLNQAEQTGWGTTASMKGYSQLYAPGIDMGSLGGLASTYVHFNAIVKENPGWYFVGWSYMEGGTDIAGTVTTDPEDEQNNIFEILPSSKTGISKIRTQEIYATFQPVLVADYKVDGMIAGTNATTTVTFDYVGERVDMSDFNLTIADNEAGNDNFEQVGDADFSVAGKVTFMIRYKGTAVGEHRGSITLVSKSGCSSLIAPLFARVASASDIEAVLYEGKDPVSPAVEGTLESVIAAAGTDQIVVLNKNYETTLAIDKKVTLDLNGYQMSNTITIANGGELTVNYSKYGGKITAAVTVNNGGKLILNGATLTSSLTNNGTVEQNGAVIVGAVANSGSMTISEGEIQGGLTTSGTLTVEGGSIKGATALTISGGSATISKGLISGTTTGLYATGGNTTIDSKLAVIYGATEAVEVNGGSANVTINNGKFEGTTPLTNTNGTLTLNAGFFKTSNTGVSLPDGKELLNVLVGPEYNDGYLYFIGTREVAKNSGVAVCKIGTTGYTTLEEALAYANNNSDKEAVIIMTNDYELPAGYYTLPSKAKLIVPMSDEQETDNPIITRVSNNRANSVAYVQPKEFRRLTFTSGVNMDVHGLIELTCTQRASDDAYAAMPHGPYGHLVMNEGSHMTLQNGSELRAWGYMTGKGETDARRGSIVREQFQMGDWKGGQNSFNMIDPNYMGGANLTTFHIFPITQYYIQNIESPVKYHPGAILSTTTSVSATFGDGGTVGITAAANDVPVVGVSGVEGQTAMFLMDIAADAENTWVRKWYDAENDVQTYDVNSGAHIGSMVLDIGKLGGWNILMNSGQFVLPITNNMKIHLLSGEMDFTQSTSLLPGAEVEIDKESTVSISVDTSHPEIVAGSLYVFDAAQWGTNSVWGKFNNNVIPIGASIVKYSASLNRQPDARSISDLPSASVNVHGTFDAKDGFVFTTEGGANIFSTNEDAGTYIFRKAAPLDQNVYLFNPYAPSAVGDMIETIPTTSARLKNASGYTTTTDAKVNQTFMYLDDAWQKKAYLFNFDCFAAEMTTDFSLEVVKQAIQTSPYYTSDYNWLSSRPYIGEYIVARRVAEGYGVNMTAADYEGMKALIETRRAQNLELPDNVAPYADLYDAIVAQVRAYKADAEYDLGSVQKIYIKPQEWIELAGTATVTIPTDDLLELEEEYRGVLLAAYSAGTQEAFANCNEIAEDYLMTINSPIIEVTGNSDHTYSDAAGAGRLFILADEDACQWWEVEKKDNLYHCIHPNNDTYYYWDEHEKAWKEKMFTITWKNWNGNIVKTANEDGELVDYYYVNYGTQAEFLGSNPTREANIDYTYNFTGWNPTPGKVTNNVTYTATYESQPRMYTIIFNNEGGTEIERHFLTHNDVPVCENTPTKVGHILQWSPAISPVIGDQIYTATWLEELPTEWDVTFVNNANGVLQATEAVGVSEHPVYDFENNGTPAKENADHSAYSSNEYTYTFWGWSAVIDGVAQQFEAGTELPSPTAPTTYTAVYTEAQKTYVVRFLDQDGNLIPGEEYNLPYGAMPVCSNTPTQANTAEWTYGFAWTPQIQTVMASEDPVEYRATFPATKNKYTVTLQCNITGACTFTGAGIYDYGTKNVTIAATINDPSAYEFVQWAETGNTNPNLGSQTITGNITLTAMVKAKDAVVTDLTVDAEHPANLTEPTSKNNLIITSNGVDASGELIGAENLTLYGNADYVLSNSFAGSTWYCVAVPWRVNVNGGIYLKGSSTPAVLGTDFDICYYDGAIRAAQGKVDACWVYLKNLGSSQQVLQPGRAYMIALRNGATSITFRKKAQEPLLTTGTSVQQYPSTIDDTHAGWNAIANPALYHAYVNAGSTDSKAQKYIAGDNSYDWFELDDAKLVVGQPIYVQAPAAKSIVANTSAYNAVPARRTQAEAQEAKFDVAITAAGASKYADHISVSLNEDKEENKYVIGQDLVKFGVSTKVAQMWIDRYDAKLCVNTVAPEGDATNFPLSIFAPAAGDYTIHHTPYTSDSDYTLYLTFNGEAIWNLSDGAYVLNLNKGTDANYGLRVSARAPQVVTGVDEAIVDAQGDTRKVLINNQVFIIRGNEVYTVTGQKLQ